MTNFDFEIENLVQKECECSDIRSLNVYLKNIIALFYTST